MSSNLPWPASPTDAHACLEEQTEHDDDQDDRDQKPDHWAPPYASCLGVAI
jgi:hypothetical protein